MCGISGFFPCADNNYNLSILKSMSDSLSHRGPDGDGVWCDNTIGLSHRRLSIFDLILGEQPMLSRSKRFVISYNGEVYNFKEIRKDLVRCGLNFRTDSDTEVILEAFEYWGLEKALTFFHGMFAISVWDSQEKILTLVRDRMGEKPSYYGWQGEVLIFGSELKSLKCHPNWSAKIDRNALSQLLKYNYIPAPLTIFSGINKLEPGHLVHFDLKNGKCKHKV